MSKSYSYFELLEGLRRSECPICAFFIKDSRRYLDHVMYESVLDVSTRLQLMDSYGFCSWHAWQIPKLPPICSPAVGFSIFASDLLRKFNFLAEAVTREFHEKSRWKSFFRKESQKLFPQMKAGACPACSHVAEFEASHLKELLDSITEKEFLEAYNASHGICLPHFFLVEESYSNHPNFRLLFKLQLSKSQSLRETLEEFIRKQDHRFQKEITPDEAKTWRVAMEFVTGKPGVFTNEMGHDLRQRLRRHRTPADKLSVEHMPLERLTVGDLLEGVKRVKNVSLYLKQPLPPVVFEGLKDLACKGSRPSIEVIVEDLENVAYLRKLHSLGFSLYYGLGLPSRPVIFLDRDRGFLFEQDRIPSNQTLKRLKNPEDLYLSLLWHRFGNAVVIAGLVKEKDEDSDLYCLLVDGKRERWFRLKNPNTTNLPKVGAMVELFAWERWGIQLLEVLDLAVLETTETTPQ